MAVEFLLKGIMISFIFGVPVEAVGVLTIRRTITHGTFAGLASGIGCSTADLLYAFISVFGLTLFSDFMLKYQSIISFVGGNLVILMGVDIILKKQTVVKETAKTSQIISFFASSFVIAITNPATIITFIWWIFIVAMIALFRNHITDNVFQKLNYIIGGFIILFGALIVIQPLR